MITVTENAVRQVKNLISKEPNSTESLLRIGVAGGGCSGLEYYLGIDDKTTEADEVFDFYGLRVAVDRESLPYLEGATLDFSTDLMNSGFIFSNPNARRSCGCGKSFCA